MNLVAHSLRGQSNASHRADSDTYVAHALNAKGSQGRMDGESETFVAAPITSGYAKGVGVNDGKKGSPQNLIVAVKHDKEPKVGIGKSPTLQGADGGSGCVSVATEYQIDDLFGQQSGPCVRRLTPRECERLQGFPDDYTLIDRANGKPVADGPRYRALGNSMAVPVMRWIGRRIQIVEEIA